MAYIDDEKVLDIKNALTVIQLNTDTITAHWHPFTIREKMRKAINEQIKRVNRLLPKIKYEKKGEKGENS